MNEKQAVSEILKTVGVLDFPGNQEHVKKLIRQGMAHEKSHLEVALEVLNNFGKKALSPLTISRQVDHLMQALE